MKDDKNNKKDENDDVSEETEKKKSNKLLKVAAVLTVIIIAFFMFQLSSIPEKNPYQIEFANETLNFRANLEKAELVPVYPDEQAIRNAILSEDVEKIKISYIPEGEYNGFYAVDSFEIAYKLTIIFKHNYGINGYLYNDNCLFFEETQKTICISSETVPSSDEITATETEPVIFLSASDETSVELKDNIVYIKGQDFSEVDRKYTDLDLATGKFLMVLMNYQQLT